jgi:hypothetical protein
MGDDGKLADAELAATVIAERREDRQEPGQDQMGP